MSKKDYKIIAKAIRESLSIDVLILRLCDEFKKDNPKFDKDKFILACKLF